MTKQLMIKQVLNDGYICLPTTEDCPYLQIQYSKEADMTRILYKNKRDFIVENKKRKEDILNMNNELELPGECHELIYKMTQNI